MTRIFSCRSLAQATTALALSLAGGVPAWAAVSNGVTVNGGGANIGGAAYDQSYADALPPLTTTPNPVNSTACPANGSTAKYSIFYSYAGASKGGTGFINNTATSIGCQTGLADDFGAADQPIAYDYSVPTGNPYGLASNQAAAYYKDLYGYQLIQVPTFGISVTVPFNLPGHTTNGALALTDAQLCGIFSGLITSWSKIPGSGSKAAIGVAYRQDGSGATFLLTNHLASVCTAKTSKITFAGTTKFGSLFPGATTDAAGNYHVPSGTFAADLSAVGSAGLQANILTDSNSVGYLGPDYTDIAADPTVDPATGTAPVVASVNKLLPSIANVATALSALKLKPVATNPDSWGVLLPKPSKGYPIVGYAYLYISSQYQSAAKVTVVKTWLDTLYNVNGNDAQSGAGNAIDAISNSGFVPLPGVSDSAKPTANSLAATIVKDYLAAKPVVPITVSSKGR